jgi:hypothetical protein
MVYRWTGNLGGDAAGVWIVKCGCSFFVAGRRSSALTPTGNRRSCWSVSQKVFLCLPHVGVLLHLVEWGLTHLEDLVEGHVLRRPGLYTPLLSVGIFLLVLGEGPGVTLSTAAGENEPVFCLRCSLLLPLPPSLFLNRNKPPSTHTSSWQLLPPN